MDWFDTTEGQEYLDERLQCEFEDLETGGGEVNTNNKDSSTESSKDDDDPLNSALLFQNIMLRLGWRSLIPKRTFFVKPMMQVAASILVIATATLFYVHTVSINTERAEAEPVIYSTTSDQQKQITLRDGSLVRLNENSSLKLGHGYNEGERKVFLSGEAFFEIYHHPDKPFIVQSGQAVIKVLGTTFNVKVNSDESEVGVAVVEGKVSLRHNEVNHEQGALLKKGAFASLNILTREINIEDYGIDNYMAWKHGRLVFDDMRMDMVCRQLGRLYEINCVFSDSEIKDRKLMANISNESLEKVLSVIGESLNLMYEIKDHEIRWKENTLNK